MKKVLILLLICLSSLAINAQRTTKYAFGFGEIEGTDYSTFIRQVDVYKNYVYVKITRCPKRDMKRLNYWYSPETRLVIDDESIPLLGALSSDEESYHSCTYDDGWGWDNVKKDEYYSFTLVFKGTVPDYVNYIDLVDDNEEYRGCTFRNIKLRDITSNQKPVETQQDPDESFDCNSYYTAYTTTALNLREGPGTNYDVITKIPEHDWVFLEQDERYNDFAKVMYIETGDEGYVSTKYLDGFTPVEVNEKGLLEVTGKSESRYAEVTLYNDADVTANIKLGKTTYRVYPHSNKTINHLWGGKYNIVVSSPGTIPYVGTENIEGGYTYQRRFYLGNKNNQ